VPYNQKLIIEVADWFYRRYITAATAAAASDPRVATQNLTAWTTHELRLKFESTPVACLDIRASLES
jgi:hypothetical protein